MRFIILLIVVASLVGCKKSDPKEALCKSWVQEDSEIACKTIFEPDGSVTVDYDNGTDLTGTWEQQDDNTFLIKIRSWEITGRIDGEKLIIKNGQNERTYTEKK